MRPFARLGVAFILLGARVVLSQDLPSTIVHVVVRDSASHPLRGADVTIVHGLNDVVVSAVTDDRGLASLTVAIGSGDYQLVVRRVGFEPVERFFRAGRDTLVFEIGLRASVRQLEAVAVTAERDPKAASYHIGADEIANSPRVLIDATDILAKLRPDMICGRSCNPMEGEAAVTRNPARKCPGLAFAKPVLSCPVDDSPPNLATNVWVNGQRIRTIALDEVALARQHGVLAGLLPGTMTVLSEIKPEHIAEITYLDEFDTSVDKIGAQAALFIVLKPGIAYSAGEESYVVDAALGVTERPPARPASLPTYRYRLLGVFDQETGDPIAGAYVIDMQTGERVTTTTTGTVSLVFLPEGGSPVRITRDGYEDLSIAVEISAETTAPLTLTMARKRAR
ncbi:MAG TPA: carboxypeptidase-like regulatory domain-containing protein [Gemmatimonadaceae bacterium]